MSQLQPETIHILLMLGQYILFPVALWLAKKFKESIVSEVQEYVDKTMNGRWTDLSDRVGRIEQILMKRARQRVAPVHPRAKRKAD